MKILLTVSLFVKFSPSVSSSPRQRSLKATLTPEQFDCLPQLSYSTLVKREDRRNETSEETDPELAISNAVPVVDCAISGTANGKAQIPGRWSECSICLEEFQLTDTIILLPICRHAYHRDCIRFWFLERQSVCPLCKSPVLPENDSDLVTVLEHEHSSVDEQATEAEERSVASAEQRTRSDSSGDEFTNLDGGEETTASGS